MPAQRLYLIVSVGLLPDASPSGVQVKLFLLYLIKSTACFTWTLGLPGVLCSLRTVPTSGLDAWAKDSSGALPEPRGAQPRGRVVSMEVAKHQEGSLGFPMSDACSSAWTV